MNKPIVLEVRALTIHEALLEAESKMEVSAIFRVTQSSDPGLDVYLAYSSVNDARLYIGKTKEA